MHRALKIQEILSIIFCHCDVPAHLAHLARTCRAFKEPALDVLWEELANLCPLTRCLPEASYQPYPPDLRRSFDRPLTTIEWDILQSYTRRVRRMSYFGWEIGQRSLEVLADASAPPTDPLFPNLRKLRCHCYPRLEARHLLRLRFPSLTSFSVTLDSNTDWWRTPLRSLSEFSPNVNYLAVQVDQSHGTIDQLVSSCILCWRNLQFVDFPQISLDMGAFEQLSQMPALTSLTLKSVVVASTHRASPLLFSNLLSLHLGPAFLAQISQLLCQIRLPAITNFAADFDDSPSRQEFASSLASLPTSNDGYTLEDIKWCQSSSSNVGRREAILLSLADLQSCTAFTNLRGILINVERNVNLTDNDLLALASAWPCLGALEINPRWGWNTSRGITPHGLLQLLQKCPSLCQVALAMDTRGYTQFHPSARCALTSRAFLLNVVDSAIEAESVPAVADFLATMASCSQLILFAWTGSDMVRTRGWEDYTARWGDVCRRASVRYIFIPPALEV